MREAEAMLPRRSNTRWVCWLKHFYSERSFFFNKSYFRHRRQSFEFVAPVRVQKPDWVDFLAVVSFFFSPVPWQFLSSSPILQSSWPSQSHFSEMQRLL